MYYSIILNMFFFYFCTCIFHCDKYVLIIQQLQTTHKGGLWIKTKIIGKKDNK